MPPLLRSQLSLLLLFTASTGWSGEPVANEALRLVLREGLPIQGRDSKVWARTVRHDVCLDLTRTGAKWEPTAWLYWSALPGLDHLGQVQEAKPTKDGVEFRIEFAIASHRASPMVIGGTLTLTVNLQESAKGPTATYHVAAKALDDPDRLAALDQAWGLGEVADEGGRSDQRTAAAMAEQRLATAELEGAATVERRAPRFAGILSHLPRPGEHPRLLMSPDQVAPLRAFGQTEAGRQLKARLEAQVTSFDWGKRHWTTGTMHGAGYGFLYQLTGDKAYAQHSANACQDALYAQLMTRGYHMQGYYLLGLALSYDFCYDAWDSEFRERVYCKLEQNLRQHAERHDLPDILGTSERFYFKPVLSGLVYDPNHPFSRHDRMAAGLAGLAILNDPPTVYIPPPAASVVEITADPSADLLPAGVLTEDFASDRMPSSWLINGPVPRDRVEEVCRQFGDPGKLRPRPGQALTIDGIAVHWRFYHPAGAGGSTPSIYLRDCGRYLTSSTANGYFPGMHVMAKGRERTGEVGLGYDFFIYTVIRNDRTRTVQTLPNWRSASYGSRMWLGGREVKDGDLVRLAPGLHPLLVQVHALGGYSTQIPKLREFTPSMRRAAEQFGPLAARLNAPTPSENHVLANVLAIARSSQRFIEERVDPIGFFDDRSDDSSTADATFTFLIALRKVLGLDLAQGTSLERLPAAAVCLRGLSTEYDLDRLVRFGYGLYGESSRRLADDYMQRFPSPLACSLDTFMAHLTLPAARTTEPVTWPAGGQVTMPLFGVQGYWNGAIGDERAVAMLWSGLESEPRSPGSICLAALGRTWIPWWPEKGFNRLAISSLTPAAPAQTAVAPFGTKGSVITISMERLLSQESKQVVPGAWWRRSLAVDTSGRGGAPMVLVVADRLAVPKGLEKIWQVAVGNVPRSATGKGFSLEPTDSKATLHATFVQPENLPLKETNTGDPNHPSFVLQISKDAPGNLDINEVAEQGPKTKVSKTGTLAEDLPQTTFLVVITVQVGEPPKVERQKDVVQVGGLRVRFDGTSLSLLE